MPLDEGSSKASVPLPEGGGAYSPVGESFEVDLVTGGGSHSVPIALPPGPRQQTPSLSLKYGVGYGNGLLGLGWSLSTTAIIRDGRDGQPRFDDAIDSFSFGGQRLVPMGNSRFRQETEKDFYRIDRVGEGWEVRTKDGGLLRYGVSPATRLDLPVSGPDRTALWLLESSGDTLGNRAIYRYAQDDGHARLSEIEYGPYLVRLSYQERPDPVTSTRLGVPQVLRHRLREIQLLFAGDGGEVPIKAYRLDYDQAQLSGASRLVSIELVAFDTSETPPVEHATPPMRFTYSDFEPAAARLERVDSALGLLPEIGQETVTVLDVEGAGLPGLFQLSATGGYYWANRGDLNFGAITRFNHFPSALAEQPDRVRIASLSAHGLLDLVVMAGPAGGFYPLKPDGTWGPFRPFRRPPPLPLLDARTQFVDLDFDGRADLLYADDSAFYAVLNRGEGDFDRPRVVRRIHDRDQFPDVDLADPAVRFADMCGDGTAALVEVRDRSVVYWPNLGQGRFGPAVRMDGPPALPPRYDPARIILTDIDGDGLADVAYVDEGRVILWINQAGGGFAPAVEIDRTPIAPPNGLLLADLRGAGHKGLLWSGARLLGTRTGHYFLDFTGAEKANLISRIESPTGAVIEIDYGTSVTETAADRGGPDEAYLPFPVQVIRRLTVTDPATGARHVSEYAYHRGHYDRRRRRFLGFGRVNRRDLGDAETPDRITVSHFHTRPPQRATEEALRRHSALSRMPHREAAYGSDDPTTPFWTQEIEGEAIEIAAGTDGTPVYFAARRRLIRRTTDRGARAIEREVIFDHDDFGNVIREEEIQRYPDPSGAPQTATKVVTTRYAAETPAYLVGLPVETVERDGSGRLLAATRLHYDGPAFQGLPLGQATAGILMRRTAIALSDAMVAEVYGSDVPALAMLGYRNENDPDLGPGWWVDEVSQVVDARGNPVTRRDARGSDTSFTFDRFGIFPVRMINALSQEVVEEYDYRFGLRHRHVGRDGKESLWRFDPHGRLVEHVGPQDPIDQPSLVYEHAPFEVPARVTIRRRATFGGALTDLHHQYFDARGQRLQIRVELGGGGRVAVNATPVARVRFQPTVMQEAYEAASTAFATDDAPVVVVQSRTRRDALDRPVEIIDPNGHVGRRVYEAGAIHHYDAEDLDPASPHFDTPRSEYFDASAKLIAVAEQLAAGDPPQITRYERNAAGLATSAIDHLGGRLFSQRFDLLGRRVLLDHRDAGQRVYVYDAAGGAVEERRGTRQLRRTFDALGRITALREGPRTSLPLETYEYDMGTGENLAGRLARVSGGFGTVEYSYTLCGRLLRKTRTFPERPGESFALEYAYDPLGRVRGVTYPNGHAVTLGYDQGGRQNSVSGVIDAVEFDPAGYLARVQFANGVETTYQYGAMPGRLEELRTAGPSGDTYQHCHFQYDRVGNPRQVDDLATVAGHVRDHRRYRYDALYRLVEAQGREPAGTYTHAFHYDALGNLLDRPEIAGGLTLAYSGNRVTTASDGEAYSYDDLGNLEQADGWAFTYDGRGRLSEQMASNGMRVLTRYDHAGARVSVQLTRPDGTVEVTSYCDDAFVIDDAGASETHIFYNRHRVAVLRSAGPDVVVHQDPYGHPSAYSDLATGNFAGQVSFYPYGGVAIAMNFGTQARYGYGSHPTVGGVLDFGVRAYSPRLGRFLQPDPAIVLQPEDAMRLPRALHPYAFVIGNPAALTDPHGANIFDDFVDWVGDTVSAIGGAIVDAVVAVGNAIVDAAVAVAGFIADAASAVWEGIKTAGEWIWEGLKWAANVVWEGIKWIGRALAFLITWTLTIIDFAITWLNPLNWIALGLDQIDHPIASALSFAIKFLRSPITTTVGLAIGLVGLATGDVENVAFRDGLIVFEWDPSSSAFSGTVFGGTVHLWSGNANADAFEHEIYHSYQYVGWGDAFIPAYVVGGLSGLLTSALAGRPQWTCFGGVSDGYTFGQPLEMGGELIDASDNCR